jgi:periplasmic divalent cation tolerance protein
MSILLVFTTVATPEQAQNLVRVLIQERRAACAQFHSVQSTYEWRGEIVNEEEFRILFKTSKENAEALMSRLREIHPYELPAICAMESSVGDDAFELWVNTQSQIHSV